MKEAEAVFAVATLGKATARDVATLIDGDDAKTGNATSALSSCYKQGWLIRRKQTKPYANGAKWRYVYAIAAPETYEELFGTEVDLAEDADEAEA